MPPYASLTDEVSFLSLRKKARKDLIRPFGPPSPCAGKAIGSLIIQHFLQAFKHRLQFTWQKIANIIG